VPTRVLAGTGDRFLPLPFQRRVARERLGLRAEVALERFPDRYFPVRTSTPAIPAAWAPSTSASRSSPTINAWLGPTPIVASAAA
jgi:hypothetical protein